MKNSTSTLLLFAKHSSLSQRWDWRFYLNWRWKSNVMSEWKKRENPRNTKINSHLSWARVEEMNKHQLNKFKWLDRRWMEDEMSQFVRIEQISCSIFVWSAHVLACQFILPELNRSSSNNVIIINSIKSN